MEIPIMDFTDKVVLVTGGSRGIGQAICKQFAERGARVAVHYLQNQQAAEQTLAQLDGQGHMLVQGQIADPDVVKSMITQVVEQMGKLDILVNNVGMYEDHPLLEVSYEEWQKSWQKLLGINLLGAANAIYCAAHVMQQQGGGRIVNISSRGAFRGEPTAPAYGASKAALNSVGQSLAKALAPYNIFIGTVAPGFVETDMAAERLSGPDGDFIRAQSPLNRVAKPEEVAYAALFLASEGAEFSTGTIIDVNGASYLRS
jgi:3-oxoacyl-[acyl-carrier protein] reductase